MSRIRDSNIEMMSKQVAKTSEIKIKIGLNDKNVPVAMEWKAEDQPDPNWKKSKAMLLSLFEPDTMDTLKIDLWTTEMQVGEMDRMMYQTFRGLADTYFKATQNRELAIEMQKFVQYFGERTEVIPKQDA